MKLRWSIVGLATMCCALLTTSCSSDDENASAGAERKYGLDVRIILPTTDGTRAEVFEDGDSAEYAVKEAHFQFFDENKHRMNIVTTTVDFTKVDPSNDNITSKSAMVTLVANRQPSYVLVHLNYPPDIVTNMNSMPYTAMTSSVTPSKGSTKDKIHTYYANSSTGFLMNNSTHFHGAEVVDLAPLDGHIYEVGTPSSGITPLNIYVEREVAKATVNVNIPEDDAISLDDRIYKIKQESGSAYAAAEYGVKFHGWRLNATNKSFSPIKKVSATYPEWAQGNVTWFSNTHCRTYWSEDPNYSDGTYLLNTMFEGTTLNTEALSLNYISMNDITTGGSTNFTGTEAEYCLENTMIGGMQSQMGAVTHVLVRAQYTKSDGTLVSENVYRGGKYIYTETELKTYIANELAHNITGIDGVTVTTNDISITRDENNFKERADVKATIKYVGTVAALVNFQNSQPEQNLNNHFFGEGTLWVYPAGVCYYSIPIRHFTDLAKEQTGYYGMVRNHWYKVNITSVDGFGYPADPRKPIVPEIITSDEYALQADINVLSWAIVDQSTNVGGTGAWD